MVNKMSLWMLCLWVIALVVTVAWSVALDARLSTSGLLLALGLAPIVVIALLARSASPPTVAEILHSLNQTSGRE